MENFVRETLISCINVLIKRSWLEDTEERRQAILHRITELLNTDLFGKRLSLMLLNGLVSEFSSEKSAQVGLTWDFHNRCKAAFEKSELRHVFDIALQVLRAALDSRDWWANAPDGQVLVNAALAALSSCLSWDFAKDDTCLKTTFAKRGEEYEDVMTTPDFPETWRDVLVRPDVLDTFFLAYVRFQDNVGYLSKCEECLIQLAGLRGRVFSDEASRKAYADHFMKGMTAILTNYPLVAKNTDPDDLGSIALALATIIRRFFSVYKISMLHDLPGFLPFLEQAGALSEATLHGMLEPTDDPFFEDAFEDLLCAWSALVTETLALHNPNPLNANNAPAFDAAGFLSVLRNVSGNLFARYLETRLQIVQNNIEDDIYESEVKDYIMYNDQLLMLSQLARLDAQRNIAKLHGVLVDRLERLGRWLAAPTQDEGYLSAIHEHMHWLILIAAFLLADTGMSEKPLLDENLVLLAASENGQSALVPGMDSIGALTKAVLDILDYVSVPTTDPRAPDLSPMVAESGMFFVARWVLTYLFIDSSDYKALPATLVAAYGRPEHGGRGPAVLDQILDLIGRNFRLWSTETDVLVQAIAALESFSKNKFLENATLSTPRFRDLVAYFLDSLATLPEDTHALLIETVARIVSGAPDENLRSAYLGSLGQAIDVSDRRACKRSWPVFPI